MTKAKAGIRKGTNSMTEKSKRLKALFQAPEILILPGIFDGYSVRSMEQMGFAAASVSGAGVSESHLGWADKGVMSFKDNLEACRALAACSDLPLMADGDTGYGNAVSVYFTVQAFEDAGHPGLMIEDQVWPKRCGHMAGKAVIPAAKMVQKVKAAVKGMMNAMADFIDMLAGDAPIDRPDLLVSFDELNRMDEKYSVAETVGHAAE